MRRRVIRTLLAAAAAGATLTTLGFSAGAASAASTARVGSNILNPPSGGTPLYTSANCPRGIIFGEFRNSANTSVTPPTPPPCSAGYEASGRDFRFAQAVIKVPTSTGSFATSPIMYVGLYASPTEFARAGIEPCSVSLACPNGWEGAYEVMQQGTPTLNVIVPFTGVAAGDGVFFSIYFNSVGNAVRFVVTLPDGTTAGQTAAVNGPVYTSAVALADWSLTFVRPEPTTPASNTRVTQFFQGRFTTLSGQHGTFNGPWGLNPVEVTTNGVAPPGGTLVSAPSYLWTDGNSFTGMPGDAFGVWLYNP